MRGSLLAVVAIAVIAGLGAVVVARNMGWIGAQPVALAPPPPTPPQPVFPDVVVLTRNLFTADAINPPDVRKRPMTANEFVDYQKDFKSYLTDVSVANYRKLSHDVEADRPLRSSDLTTQVKPPSIHERLLPGTVAVPLYVPRENSGGGLIQVGDWVDVYLNTDIGRSDLPGSVPYTGILLQRAPVIAKRDTLHDISAALPALGEPIPYTIAANPYRAALIDFARHYGTISLVPVSPVEKQKLDAMRADAKTNPQPQNAIPFAEVDSPEYKSELERIDRYKRLGQGVGFDDLGQVLNLPPLSPLSRPVSIDVISGVTKSKTIAFPNYDQPIRAVRYEFSNPNSAVRKPGAGPAPVTPNPAGSGTTVKPTIVPVRN